MARGNVHTKTENRSKYKHCVGPEKPDCEPKASVPPATLEKV